MNVTHKKKSSMDVMCSGTIVWWYADGIFESRGRIVSFCFFFVVGNILLFFICFALVTFYPPQTRTILSIFVCCFPRKTRSPHTISDICHCLNCMPAQSLLSPLFKHTNAILYNINPMVISFAYVFLC